VGACERTGGAGGFGRCDVGREVGAFDLPGTGTLNDGGAGSAAGPGDADAVAPGAAGGRDGGRGGTGRLRLPAGGTESGFCLTGGGGGRLRGSLLVAALAPGATGGAAGVGAGAGAAAGAAGRGGMDGGIDDRGRGGAGFFDGFASSAMQSTAYTKPETNRLGQADLPSRRRYPLRSFGMLCGGAR
jgi:hypothetical protein